MSGSTTEGGASLGRDAGGEPSAASVVERLLSRLDAALEHLAEAKPFAKSIYQTDVFQIAEALMNAEGGLDALYSRAHRFDAAGVFEGGPWLDASKLQPPLVEGSLKARGVYPVVETLSELRVLAIARGRVEAGATTMSREDAVEFLQDVMALNLEFIFPADTEEERISGGPHRASNIRLFGLIAREIGLRSLLADVVDEIEQISAQRPINCARLTRMVDMATRIPADAVEPAVAERLQVFASAAHAPTPLSVELSDLAAYRQALKDCDAAKLDAEARMFADSINETGLVAPHHAVLVRRVCAQAPELLGVALGLGAQGRAELEAQQELVLRLCKVAILPATAQAIYGLAGVLKRAMLSRSEVAAGLQRLVSLDLQSDVRRTLLARRAHRDGVTANALLVAGALSVLGRPLGVGQGNNPTCQAARGISLWSQHAPGYLLEMLISAARDGLVEKDFEGERLKSSDIEHGLVLRLDTDLDPVSLVLVPHLDRLYSLMMKRVATRSEDGHKWVNPAFYGRWVPHGFASVFADVAQTTVAEHDDFVRRFYATHHPAYNEGHDLMYPNPVGLCITNARGDYLGPHAVSLLRVGEDPHGALRVYFFNPNNEGRQDWGHGVRPSIRGNGESEGESSLPFHQMVTRLYAFHYNPYEEGDAFAVPPETLQEVEQAARGSWGRAFSWR
ncbi:MAG: hypothetical protein KC503_26705 [Myxococcales bacterium]|nr:hypothetical protein [Myxococcales bacterium]